jgi:hypothetical protein
LETEYVTIYAYIVIYINIHIYIYIGFVVSNDFFVDHINNITEETIRSSMKYWYVCIHINTYVHIHM